MTSKHTIERHFEEVDELHDTIALLRGRIMELESSWLPAENAPYGVKVLAWMVFPNNPLANGPVIASRCFVEQDEPESYGDMRMTVGCWWANRYYRGSRFGEPEVTNWMPLPPPPGLD